MYVCDDQHMDNIKSYFMTQSFSDISIIIVIINSWYCACQISLLMNMYVHEYCCANNPQPVFQKYINFMPVISYCNQ